MGPASFWQYAAWPAAAVFGLLAGILDSTST
jgi:hypothetical protein